MDDESANLLADAYFRSGKDPKKMAEILGVSTLDLDLLTHPLVRTKILERAKAMSQRYTLDEHLDKLQEIRDACLSDTNYKVALAAEIALGKAAGLYEKIQDPDEDPGATPEKLSTAQIRALLLKQVGVPSLPAPHTEEDLPEEKLQ